MSNPWENLHLPQTNATALRVSSTHPLDLFWACDQFGRYIFVYEFLLNEECASHRMPDLVGIETGIHPTLKAKAQLVLTLNETTNWELFYALCNDLIVATQESNDPHLAIGVIVARLENWQEFLKKNPAGILSENKIKGLIGELQFILRHLIPKFGGINSVNFWIGPEDAPQDFNVNKAAIEVKCKMGGTKPKIKISSADQLYTQLQHLYLYVVTLGKSSADTPSSFNLPNLVEEIEQSLTSEAKNAFHTKLIRMGYFHSEKYLDFNYVLTKEEGFQIEEGFPRIICDQLIEGIEDVTYSIKLSHCNSYKLDIDLMELTDE